MCQKVNSTWLNSHKYYKSSYFKFSANIHILFEMYTSIKLIISKIAFCLYTSDLKLKNILMKDLIN